MCENGSLHNNLRGVGLAFGICGFDGISTDYKGMEFEEEEEDEDFDDLSDLDLLLLWALLFPPPPIPTPVGSGILKLFE